ncbi:MAG: ABA4-like family protein [Pseudomonadota bacterium]
MDYELIFSVAGLLAMLGWLLLLASPFMPKWSDRLAGLVIPLGLSIGYCTLIIIAPPESGGFGSLAEVAELFSEPQALLAGWIHFLAFDLFVGAWICRKARSERISFWFVLPCLPITFLLGPAGFLAFSIVRSGRSLLKNA